MTTQTSKSAIQRGEIWLVEFDPARGAEIQKTRPALVVNMDSMGRLPLRIVVPVTDWKEIFSRFSWFVHLTPTQDNGLSKESGADVFQIKSLSEERFVRRLGKITNEQMSQVAKTIAFCVGYEP